MGDQIKIKVGLDGKEAKTGLDELKAQQAAIKKQQADKATETKYDAEAAAIRKKAAFDQLSASEKILALDRQRLSLVTQIAAAENIGSKAKLGAKLAQTEADLAAAKSARSGGLKSAALGAGALVATGAVMVGADILQQAGQLADLSAQFNIASDSIQRIGNVAGQSGVELTSVAGALNKTAISQEKARKNSQEHVEALEGLGITVEDFINLTPENAFYAIADAVAESTDRSKAYAAVQQLMGKSSGELFSTLEMGGPAIRKLGEEMGVWSEETNRKLDDAGDQWAANWNKIKVEVAQLMAWAISAAQTLGVVAAKVWGFLTMNKSLRDAAGEEFDKIWGNGPKEDKKPESERRDREAKKEAAEEARKQMDERAKKQKEIADLEGKLSDTQKKAAFDALKPAEQFNALIKERATLEASLGQDMMGIDDSLRGKIKLAELDAEILKRRETADQKAESDADKLAAKRAALAEKEFKASLDGMSAEEKKNALLQKRIELQKQINAETDEGKKIDLKSKRIDLDKEIAGIKPDATAAQKRTLIAGGMTNLGIGYAAALSGPSDPQREIAKNTKDLKTATDAANKLLEKIEAKLGPAKWNK